MNGQIAVRPLFLTTRHGKRKKVRLYDILQKNNKGGKYYVFQTQKINSENL